MFRRVITSVRSATRITALRARGLAATSAAPGLMRASARQPHGLRRGKGHGGRTPPWSAGDELLDDAVFQRVEADHHQPPPGAAPQAGL
jgi:hypothetical protein